MVNDSMGLTIFQEQEDDSACSSPVQLWADYLFVVTGFACIFGYLSASVFSGCVGRFADMTLEILHGLGIAMLALIGVLVIKKKLFSVLDFLTSTRYFFCLLFCAVYTISVIVHPYYDRCGIVVVPLTPICLLLMLTCIKYMSVLAFSIRLVCLAAICGFIALFLKYPVQQFCMDLGLQMSVHCSSDLDELQDWAVKTLELPQGNVSCDNTGRNLISGDALPDAMKQLGTPRVYIWNRKPEPEAIVVQFGGGHHHWGFYIGPPSFKACSNDREWIWKWRPGIYGYQDR